MERATAVQKHLEHLSEVDLDVGVFQELPLHIRSRVLKEAQVLFVRDEDMLYEIATRTVRAFEDFKPIQRYTSTKSRVVDRDRILATLDELNGYLRTSP